MPNRPAPLTSIALLLPLLGLVLYASGGLVSSIKADPPDVPVAEPRPIAPRGLPAARPMVVALAVPATAPSPASQLPSVDRERSERDRKAVPVTAAAPTQSEVAGLGEAERLSIRVQGFPDLTGEYRLRSDGSISIPVVGRMVVTGMNHSDLEGALAQRLTRATGREAFVTVEISEYRPVFVTGFVSRSGSFPWRPGMTVLQAQTLAGGLFRSGGDSTPAMGEDAVLVRWQKSITDQKRNLAALARLQAERQGAAVIEVPQVLVNLVGPAEADALIAAQTSALVSRRSALEAKRAALARATLMANKELAGLTEQAARLKITLNTRRNYKEKIDTLQTKGIVRAERSIDEASRVSDLEDRDTSVNVAIARVHVMLAALERDRVNLEHERRAETDTDIISMERHIAQLDIDIEAARNGYRKLTGNEPPMSLVSSDAPKKLTIKYEIVRQTMDRSATLVPDHLVQLRPGDTLVISVE